MYALILSIALCGTTAPVADNIQKTIELIHKRAGGCVEGVFTVDNSGYVLGVVLERIPRPLGHRDHTVTPGAWRVLPVGICDDLGDCERKVKQLCKDAGHCGVTEGTVTITKHDDGGATCSADCSCNGAVAFATCNAPAKP